MKKLFVFVGDGSSGKTTLIAELAERHPNKFRKVVTRTSRSMRTGEVDGEDYHFLPRAYFVGNPELVLVKETDRGDYYGTKKADLFLSTHHLLLTSRPTGVLKLFALGFRNIVVVRIEICEALKIARMRQRGDSEEVISERLKSDISTSMEADFADALIIELNASQSLDEKVGSILKAC